MRNVMFFSLLVGMLISVPAMAVPTTLYLDTDNFDIEELGENGSPVGYDKATGEMLVCYDGGVLERRVRGYICSQRFSSNYSPATLQLAAELQAKKKGIKRPVQLVGYEFILAGGRGTTVKGLYLFVRPEPIKMAPNKEWLKNE